MWQQSVAPNVPTLLCVIQHNEFSILVYLHIKYCIELILWELTSWEVDLVGVELMGGHPDSHGLVSKSHGINWHHDTKVSNLECWPSYQEISLHKLSTMSKVN